MARLLGRGADLKAIVDAALMGGGNDAWCMRIALAAKGTLQGATGVAVQTMRHERMQPVSIRTIGWGTGANMRDTVMPIVKRDEAVRALGQADFQGIYYPPVPAVMMNAHLRRLGHEPGPLLAAFGAIEVGGVVAPTSRNEVVVFIFQLDHEYTFTAHEQRVLNRLSLYLGLGARARKVGSVGSVLAPTGDQIDGAPHENARLWEGLCAGRFGLVRRAATHFHIVEHARRDWLKRALTPIERQVLELAARGVPGKIQACELGIATTTASLQLKNAAAKLGLISVLDAIRIIAGLTRRGPRAPFDGLTDTEREIVDLIRQGLSNRGIASRRDVSERTVANQVSAVLRKTHLPSRRAVAAAS